MLLKFFTRPFLLCLCVAMLSTVSLLFVDQASAGFNKQISQPLLMIEAPLPVISGFTPIVRVPIVLSNNLEMTAAGFSIGFDSECLALIESDVDQNGLLDGIKLSLPAEFSTFSNFDLADVNGQIDFVIADILPPFQPIPDGALVELTFIPTCTVGHEESRTAKIWFGESPAPSFGNAGLQKIEVSLQDGHVPFVSAASGTAVLPPLTPGLPETPIIPVPGNQAPTTAVDMISLDEDSSIIFNPTINDVDADGGTLTLSALVVEPVSGTATLLADGQIEYVPSANFFGPDALIYLISDGQGGTATGLVEFEVNAVNDLPYFVDFPEQIISLEGDNVDVQITADDQEGGTAAVTFSIFGIPPGVLFDSQTGALTGTLTDSSAGDYEVIVIASDGEESVSDFFLWTVEAPQVDGATDPSSEIYLPVIQ